MRIKLALSSVLLAAVLGLACDDSPSAPSPVPSTPPQPAAPPVPDISNLAGVWNLMVRVADVSGSGCIADTMRSQIGLPERYSLSITRNNDKVEATLRRASGDYACTFPPVVDGDSFTTYGHPGTYRCEQMYLNFRCSDGTPHRIFSFGEDIAGHLSGTEMNGTWDAAWFEELSSIAVVMKAEFTGTR